MSHNEQYAQVVEEEQFKQMANATRNTHNTQQTIVTNNTVFDKTNLTSLTLLSDSGSQSSSPVDDNQIRGNFDQRDHKFIKSAGTIALQFAQADDHEDLGYQSLN